MIAFLRPRRRAVPVALFTTAAYLLTLLYPLSAAAQDLGAGAVPVPDSEIEQGPSAPVAEGKEPHEPRGAAAEGGSERTVAGTPSAAASASNAVATGSGGTSSGLALPSGAGTTQGMGESFSAQLSTGVASYGLAIALPAARGGVQPQLALSYSSAGGSGVVGIGWNIGAPYIARQTDHAPPRYQDPPAGAGWAPTQDSFTFNGAELVPICFVENGGACTGKLPDEVMPVWATGWQYFRTRIEGSFQRIFWSPDRFTWRVQDKNGSSMEFGIPLDGSGDRNALETDGGSRIFRWNISRAYDTAGEANAAAQAEPHPFNVVVYRYRHDGGIAYPVDLYDTPPAGSPTAPLSAYAHHAHLDWSSRPDVLANFRRGWEVRQGLRLLRVDVSSKPFANAISSPRRQLRRYRLSYDPNYHASLLTTVQVEGRCAGNEDAAPAEGADGVLPPSSCPALPPISLSYSHVAAPQDIPGFEGFDDTLHSVSNSPPAGFSNGYTGLYDVNADGLPDVLDTQAAVHQGNHLVYLQGTTGAVDTFGSALSMAVAPTSGIDGATLNFTNPRILPLDLDGDGIENLVHLQVRQTPVIFKPQPSGSSFIWSGREVARNGTLDPTIDFANSRGQVRTVDANNDGFVDFVVSGTTRLQTFFALGRLPGGDGRFGSGTWTGPGTSQLSADPVTACAPYSGGPIFFDQPEVKLAEVNGDGLIDIVYLRNGNVVYWPGRGDGTWGTGNLSNCRDGFLGEDRLVAMDNSPFVSGAEDASFQMGDINGDGLSDVMQISHSGVTVWLNVDGISWTRAHSLSMRPVAELNVRVADLNGSGTPDLVWGDGYKYRYVDWLGGQRPWLLTGVDNGLGKTTTIEYSTSTAEMLAARASGHAWAQTSPTVVQVVKRMTLRDNLERAGGAAGVYVTEYGYRDPFYDGRQREFKGFRSATERKVGDANSPSSTTESTFLLGECTDEGTAGRCADDARWRDNPREALKGLAVTTETFDDNGVYASTAHTTYRLRRLYVGLDGREVRYAFTSRSNTYVYDTGKFLPATTTASIVDVELELAPPLPDGSPTDSGLILDTRRNLALRSSAGRILIEREWWADAFGSATRMRDDGCIDGCGAADEAITSVTVPTRTIEDGSGWLWRTTETYVVGSNSPTQRRHHTSTVHDAFGRPVSTSAELYGTLALDRFHEGGSSVAPPPATASADGTISLGSVSYDSVGNPTRVIGAAGRCATNEYDDSYAQFITATSTFAATSGAACRGVAMTTTAEYDRGFAQTTSLTGPNGEQQRAAFDAFGRTQAIYRPDPTTGAAQTIPSVVYEYDLPQNSAARPYALVHTVSQVGTTASPRTHEQWAFIDGLGRSLLGLSQADPSAGDGGDWIAADVSKYDAKGALAGTYRPWFWTGPPTGFPIGSPPPTRIARQRFDAFGHPAMTYGFDGSPRMRTVRHALSEELWDAADMAQGPHGGTYTSVLHDGHGRMRVSAEHVHVGSALEVHEVRTDYLPSGEPVIITRVRVGAEEPPVVRWMRYDSLGRLVLNVDPNSARNFSPDPNAELGTLKAWRYAYDDAGQLVGTSDPRGCGENFAYDTAGRELAEDYSPCLANQPAYSPLDISTGDGAEEYFVYDAAPASVAGSDSACSVSTENAFAFGRLAASFSRGEKSVPFYDALGRITCAARQMAKPGDGIQEISARYAPRWYATQAQFDQADRLIASTTGARSSDLLGQSGESTVSIEYSARGQAKSIGSSYGPLVTKMTSDAEGHPLEIVYGDIAATTTNMAYDERLRLQSVQTYRGPPSIWTSPTGSYQPPPGTNPTTLQKVLEDRVIVYDQADNPIEIRDRRIADEWPAGAKPVDQTITYDDLYRVTSVRYGSGNDSWTPPFKAETHADERVEPMPFASFLSRIREQQFAYDWLGNIVTSNDDASGFYDRSLGVSEHGTSNAGPYQLRHASNRTLSGDYPGDLDAAYDDAGNLVTLIILRDGACTSGASCAQRFSYEWDEVGRLAHAWRWDLSVAERNGEPSSTAGAPPSRAPDAILHFAYDESDARVRKTSVDSSGRERHALYVFSSLELRQAAWLGDDYQIDAVTEVPFLIVEGARLGRVVYAEDSAPTVSGTRQHVFIELPHGLGSTGVVLDRETSELVEAVTYQAYGATESDYRPERWGEFREDYRFTGKEDDIELGLTYFGKRYYAPALGRWISPDPLAIHELKADPNVYAYVHGRTFASVDPNGTCEIICIMLIAAAVSATINIISQGTEGFTTSSFDAGKVQLTPVVIAAAAGAAGGAAGFGVAVAIGPILTGGALGVTGGGLLTAAGSGAVGGIGGGIMGRGLTGIATGDPDTLKHTFDTEAIGTDILIGAGAGVVGFGLGTGWRAIRDGASGTPGSGGLQVRTGIRAGGGPAGGAGSGGGGAPTLGVKPVVDFPVLKVPTYEAPNAPKPVGTGAPRTTPPLRPLPTGDVLPPPSASVAEDAMWQARVPQYEGGKVSGTLVSGKDWIDLTSGYKGPTAELPRTGNPGMNWRIRAHVEAHAAAVMRTQGWSRATLYLNKLPCGGATGCGAMLSRMLPAGAQLRVVVPGYEPMLYSGPNR